MSASTETGVSKRPAGGLFQRQQHEYPLVCGLYSDRNKACLHSRATRSRSCHKVLDGLDNQSRRHVQGSAPCHQVVITGDAIDLYSLPIPTTARRTAGPTSPPGIVVSKDPETGVPDIGHYRFLILGKDTVSVSRRSRFIASEKICPSPEDGASSRRPR